MSESITTTTSTAVSEYAGMTGEDLILAIKKQAGTVVAKNKEIDHCMKLIGGMLIELKQRYGHGVFLIRATHETGLPPRTIQRYMAMARGPAQKRHVSHLPAPAPRRRPSTEGAIEAVIVEPAAPPPAPAQAPLETPVEIEVEVEVEEPPAPLVAAPTASPAPSLIEASESTLAEILELLKRLRPAEITELHRVIESRWMKTTSTAPATLSEAWSKTSPEDRAAFLETAHLIEKP
jgi:hypothetical protein